ncbi:sugar phosphate nucleotidyltransferase [Desulfovirgula thermocuniculi]|uniref:sugar phosphate nucleotidyltransferase n=1 Tax=Desulfovirgula thermocuniculi TaxID=348842 RepID=UPI0004217B47|nr:sugar phosphate nucleotidyltransferase [Desulfovirgula thermocuniculi]
MKAVIMAGGEGSRLRPLTCDRPKPMVPVANRPMMAHIVELLREHGFHEVAVTLQYMPEAIRDYFGHGARFGLEMRYFVEETPLGTAGSVRNARDFLDETFLVISGDALTDLDLSKAVEFHRRSGAMATIVLTRVDLPLEYGVVITGPDGRIARFLEKPSWSEVFSDTVNTGIYVLEPEVLEYIEPDRMFDFSKDLFPLLLREKKPLYGVVLPGYWCDIGNLTQYLQSHHDVLEGKVRIGLPAREVEPGIWVGEGADISAAARLRPPVLIGDGCCIGPGAEVGPYAVLGPGCIVRDKASIKRSVLWNNVYVGEGATLRGAVLASRVQVLRQAALYEGAVVGSDSLVKEHATIKPSVKLWPGKLVESGAVVQESLVWGTRQPKKIFGQKGISGIPNLEITPEMACRLGSAFASAAGPAGVQLSAGCDGHPAAVMIKNALVAGMQASGARVVDLGTCLAPLHRFAVRHLGLKGGVHVHYSPREGSLHLAFLDQRGGNISHSLERKVENLLWREDYRRVDAGHLLSPQKAPPVAEEYLQFLLRYCQPALWKPGALRLLVAFDREDVGRLVDYLAERLGLQVEALGAVGADLSEALAQISREVPERGAPLGAIISTDGGYLALVDERGRIIAGEMLTALLALVDLRSRGEPVAVPVTAPRAVELLAQKYQGKVVRTKASLHDLLEKVMPLGELRVFVHLDPLGALLYVLDYAARNGLTLGQLVDEIPAFYLEQREVPVPWETKGLVIRRLIEDPPTNQLELLDGVKVYHPQGWALVLPDPDMPVCRVFAEGASMEIARSLSDFYIEKIKEIVAGRM